MAYLLLVELADSEYEPLDDLHALAKRRLDIFADDANNAGEISLQRKKARHLSLLCSWLNSKN